MFGKKKSKSNEPEYEFQVVDVFVRAFRGTAKGATKKIKEMQKDGWEFVSESSGNLNKTTLVFRRLK